MAIPLPYPRFRPTPRAIALAGGGAPAAWLLVIADPGLWPVAMACGLGLLLLIGLDAALASDDRDLRVAVSPPSLLYIGNPDPLRLTAGFAGGRRPTAVTVLCDMSALLTPQPAQHHVLLPGATVDITIDLHPTRRGTGVVDRLWFGWVGPYGLVARRRGVPVAAAIAIVPDIRAVQTAAISLQFSDAILGCKPQRQQGDGSEYAALREYAPGLDHRSIDWKQSARHRKLYCKEFQTERNHQIVLAIDSGHLMSEPLVGVPRLDHAINAGLLLGYISLRAGDRVGLFGFDSRERLYAEPVGGRAGFTRLRRLSANLDYAPEETNFTLGLTTLLTRLTRRSLVVLITEFVDTVTAALMIETVGRLAARHVVIFVTLRDPGLQAVIDDQPDDYRAVARSVIAADMLRDRRVVQERLRRLGVHCLDAAHDRIGPRLIERYLDLKRQDAI